MEHIIHLQRTPKTQASDIVLTALPPLALYIHIPWCVRKCPYCDFNSHELSGGLDADLERAYIQALIADLDGILPQVWGRRLVSIFIGGGTPSVLSERALDELLCAVRARLPFVSEIEITMEANPGTLDMNKLQGFRAAGVTRLSLGVQSFNEAHLQAIGRIHSARQAHQALEAAYRIFPQVNLDLMFALPQQTLAELGQDIASALAYQPSHLSYYHLTIEPNTYFHRHPPTVPDDELAIDMQDAVQSALMQAGLQHYEVSAYARSGYECAHNRNYWQFGDYIGIGAGAHGKISQHDGIVRTANFKHPQTYIETMREQGHARENMQMLTRAQLPFEYMLNALRLRSGTTLAQMQVATGLNVTDLEPQLSELQARGLMVTEANALCVTDLGWRFLSDVQARFLD